MPICNDISERLGIKVKYLKITQNLGLHVHKNVNALLYEGLLTYHPSACVCCGIKNDNYLIIKHGFRKTKVYMGLIFERPAYLLKFSRKQREKVKTFSIDMFPPYILLIQD